MSYGRNFDFRISPDAKSRHGRHVVPSTGNPIPLGAPVEVDLSQAPDSVARQPLKLAVNGGTGVPNTGNHGILVYEHVIPYGVDPVLTTWSDFDTAPLGSVVQLVVDPDVKVVLRNTLARHFLGRAYPGRIMVAGVSVATPSIAVGDYLKPGAGNDTDGYWTEATDTTTAWLVVTSVDFTRAEVEARMLIY